VVVAEVRVVGKRGSSSRARGGKAGVVQAFKGQRFRGFPFVRFRGRVSVTSRSSETRYRRAGERRRGGFMGKEERGGTSTYHVHVDTQRCKLAADEITYSTAYAIK
jgi:hypothetical protein